MEWFVAEMPGFGPIFYNAGLQDVLMVRKADGVLRSTAST